MNKEKEKQIQAAAVELYAACQSILDSCEDMGLGDIGALDDVRAALQAAGDSIDAALDALPKKANEYNELADGLYTVSPWKNFNTKI